MEKINIAIDGPSGVGKSSVAKEIASRLKLTFINTGLMYRSIGFYVLKNHLNIEDENEIFNSIQKVKIDLLPNEIIKINDQNITKELWSDQISVAASKIAAYKKIREFCVKKQQQIAKEQPGVIMEGRDIGSVVLKDAQLKIFLTASNEIRVKRRIKQLIEKGHSVDEKEIMKNIIERDKRDSQRENTPLIKVPDAIEIDTSNLTFEQVVGKIVELAKERMN